MEAQANNSRCDENYQVGDQVLLSTRFFKNPADLVHGRILAPKYAGPYEVIEKVSPVAYKLPGTNVHPVFHHPYYAPTTPTLPGSEHRPSLSLYESRNRFSMFSMRVYRLLPLLGLCEATA
jgi:hypothetical protein